MKEVVYFISAGGRIKIGFTANLPRRLSQIAVSSPERPMLIGHVAGDREFEAAIHARLAEFRRHGEWFADHTEVRSVIADVQARGKDAIHEHFFVRSSVVRHHDKAPMDGNVPWFIQRLIVLRQHPVLRSVRTARAQEIERALPAGTLCLAAIPGPDKSDRHHKAGVILQEAYETLSGIETELFRTRLVAAASGSKDHSIELLDELARSIVSTAEERLCELLGPLDADAEASAVHDLEASVDLISGARKVAAAADIGGVL